MLKRPDAISPLSPPGTDRPSRRDFLLRTSALGLTGAVFASPLRLLAEDALSEPSFHRLSESESLSADEQEHRIDVRLPIIAEDGANVPLIVNMPNHPMTPDHYIKSLQIVNFKDPIASKGLFTFTPANGQAYISTQIRMDGGDTDLQILAECSQHGRWVTRKTLKVSLGGC